MENFGYAPDLRAALGRVGVVLKKEKETTAETECPWCKKPMTLNFTKGVFHCWHCDAGGGTLALIAQILDSRGELNAKSNTEKDRREAAFKYLEGNGISQKSEKKIQDEKKWEEEKSFIESVDECANTYEALLDKLTLSEENFRNLQARGLPTETIKKNGYKSVPIIGNKTIADELKEMDFKLSGVPGFIKVDSEEEIKYVPDGFFIPVRDLYGRITGIQIRANNPQIYSEVQRVFSKVKTSDSNEYVANKIIAGALKVSKGDTVYSKKTERAEKLLESTNDLRFVRYTWFSGNGYKFGKEVPGTSIPAIRQVHHVGFDINNLPNKVIVTEGPLKADIFHEFKKDVAIIALPGVSRADVLTAWIQEYQNLSEEKLEKIAFAFDMDQYDVPKEGEVNHVAEAVKKCHDVADEYGIAYTTIRWDQKYKGIDDYCLAKSRGEI